jgi:hypothetical protein
VLAHLLLFVQPIKLYDGVWASIARQRSRLPPTINFFVHPQILGWYVTQITNNISHHRGYECIVFTNEWKNRKKLEPIGCTPQVGYLCPSRNYRFLKTTGIASSPHYLYGYSLASRDTSFHRPTTTVSPKCCVSLSI